MPWLRVDDALAYASTEQAAAEIKKLAGAPPKQPIRDRIAALEKCGSCNGVINMMTGECRCSG